MDIAARTWAAFALGVFVFSLSYFREYSPDTPFHLAAGRLAVEEGRVADRSDFLAGFPGREWVDHEWLFQVVVAELYRLKGIASVTLMRMVLAAAILCFAWRACRGAGFSARLVSAAAGLALMSSRFMIRPEMFSLLLCEVFVWALLSGSRGRLLALPAVGVLWANVHGYFLAGPLLVALAAAFPPRPATPQSGPIPRSTYLKVALPVFAGAAINPRGVTGLVYPLSKVAGAFGAHRDVLRNIVELRSPWSAAFRSMVAARLYFVMLGLTVGAGMVAWRKTSSFERTTVFAAALSSGLAARNIGFFAVVAMPIAALWLSQAYCRLLRAVPHGPSRRSRVLQNVFLFIGGGALLMASRGALSDRLYVSMGHLRRSGCGWSRIAYPRRGIDFLLDGPTPKSVLNNFETGGYIVFRAYPHVKPVIASNTDLCPLAFLKAFFMAQDAGSDMARLADLLGVECMFLAHQYTPVAVYASLAKNRHWALLYFDEQCSTWARRPANSSEESSIMDTARHPDTSVFPDETPFYTDRLRKVLSSLRLLPGRSPSVVMRMRFAQFLQSIGRGDEAIIQARTAIGIAPRNTSARLWFGALLYSKGRLAEAQEAFEELLAVAPRCAGVRTFLGLIAMSRNHMPLAQRYWEEELRIRPCQAAEYSNRGLLHMILGNRERAIECFREALRRNPSIATARENLRLLTAQRGGVIQGPSSRTPRSIASLGPKASAKYWINLGANYAERGKDACALTCYQRAAKEDPTSADAYYNAGNAQFRMGHLDAAAAAYQEAIKRNPNDPEAHFRLGGVYAEQGRYPDAYAEWKRVLALAPSHKGVRRNLPLLLQKLKPGSYTAP